MRFVVVSLAVHAVVIAWLAWPGRAEERVAERRLPVAASEPLAVEVIGVAGGGGGGGGPGGKAGAAQSRAAWKRARTADAWAEVSIRNEAPDDRNGIGNGNGIGRGNGTGKGNGHGNGIGFGNGGGVQVARDVPAPPAPVEQPVSKARPAKLIWPNRDLEVSDESYLFIARVTVDTDGSVVGARMVKTRPGARGEHAANAIWQFRYLPALDERGVPVRSILEQQFQVR